MEIRWLKYFMAIAEEKSFIAAARRLNMSQPPLSRMVQKMEEELGTELFYRNTRNLELTDAGRLLFKKANDILNLTDSVTKDVSDIGNGFSGTVNLATLPSIGYKLLPSIVISFKRQYPSVQFRINEGVTARITEQIEQGICEIGFARLPIDVNLYHYKEIQKEPLVVIMTKEHPLASVEGPLTMGDICNEEFVLSNKMEGLLNNYYHSKNHVMNVVCRCSNLGMTVNYVRQGSWISVTPHTDVIDLCAVDGSVVIKHLTDPPFELTAVVIWSKQKPLSKVAQRFLDYTMEYLDIEYLENTED